MGQLSNFTLAFCGAMALSGAAYAQQFSGAATLGYSHSSVSNGGGDINSWTLDAVGDLSFGNNMTLGMVGSFGNINPDGAGDLNATDLGLDLRYQFTNGARIGGYVDYASLDFNPGGSIDLTSYGVMGGYQAERFNIDLHIGVTDTSPTLIPGLDWVDYGVNVGYDVSDNTRIAGHYIVSNLSVGGGDVNLTSFGIAADHHFGKGWSAYGGLSWFDIDVANIEMVSASVGVGYDMSQVVNVPVQLSLELARNTVNASGGGFATDMDTIRVGVTMPLGQNTRAIPQNSAAAKIMRPRHNAASTAFSMAF